MCQCLIKKSTCDRYLRARIKRKPGVLCFASFTPRPEWQLSSRRQIILPFPMVSPTFFFFFLLSLWRVLPVQYLFTHIWCLGEQQFVGRRRSGKDARGEFKQVITVASRTYPLYTLQSLKLDLRNGRLIEDLSQGFWNIFYGGAKLLQCCFLLPVAKAKWFHRFFPSSPTYIFG